VLLDACHYAARQFQSRTAGGAVGGRFAARAHGLQKRLELRMQRFHARRGQLFKRKLRLRSGPPHADAQSIAPRVIERNVLVLLEESHFTHAFRRNPACGHVGDGSAREFQAHVSDVHLVRQHGYAHRFQFRHWLLHQRHPFVQIVDHCVVNHLHIEAARGKHSQAMHFEKKRTVKNRLNRCHGGIKAFDVAHLQNPFVSPRRFKKRIRFRKIHSHGLLNQHVQPTLEQPTTHFGVGYCRHRYADCFGQLADFFEAAQRACLKFYSDSFRARLILIVDANKFGTLQLAVHPCVVAPKFPSTDDSGADFSRFWYRRAHLIFIPLEAFLGSALAGAANAWMAISAASANSINFCRSNNKVRPASTARAVARELFICSMVGKPTTGTSKRMSCRGLLTFTTTKGFPAAIRAARAMASSVPSMASTATQAWSEITTVCPMSIAAICRATLCPYAMSALSCSFGALRVSTPGSGNSGFRNKVESTS